MAPSNVDITCNQSRFAGWNLRGMYGHMSQVEMPPPDPMDQSITRTIVWFPSTWPLSLGMQAVSPLHIDGKKEFYMATSPL
jgi:hypothetical protein